ncbi:MAG TPA: ABC transporter substrate-binding protein [Gaiellales bacterium]|jgi:iron complex transport system substrate-binding protein|nr:ABC transporter substrate-binding protein [Gaiellales bacterium]
MPLPRRICSLLPSATEIICQLGCGDRLVGRSAECQFPGSVTALPVVTAARIDTSRMAGAEIDRAVREAVLDGQSLYSLDEELIGRLEPDLVVTQDLCRVCAVSSDEVSRIQALDVDVLALDPHDIAGVAESVRILAARLGVAGRGDALANDMLARIEGVRRSLAGRRRPRVFVAEWLDPPFAAGHWVPEMVAAAGGAEVLGGAGRPSVPVAWTDVAAASPELVVAAPCGYTAERAAAEAAAIPDLGCPVVAVHADAFYSRPAPRIADGVAQLAHLLHPDAVADPGLPAISPPLRAPA